MRTAGLPLFMAFVASTPVSATAPSFPSKMNCKVSGHAGCSDDGICVGAGTSDPTIKLSISRLSRTLVLNGILGKIDDGNSDPYEVGTHSVRWKWGVIAFKTYRLNQPQPGRLFLTLGGGETELEFLCLGSREARN